VGTSLWRIMLPVGLFGVVISALAFGVNEFLVPLASMRATALKEQITAQLDGRSMRPTSYPIYESGRLTAMVTAQNFNIAQRALDNVTIIFYDRASTPKMFLTAQRMEFDLQKGKLDPRSGWRAIGTVKLITDQGNATTFQNAWPTQVQRPEFTDQDLLAADIKDLDSLSMQQIGVQIQKLRKNHTAADKIINLEFGYWNKLAIPLAAVVYALVGAPLGIRNHRTGAATGFWLSVVIIFGYLMLTNFMSIWAQGGAIPAWLASFLPLVVGLAVGGITILRKNG